MTLHIINKDNQTRKFKPGTHTIAGIATFKTSTCDYEMGKLKEKLF
jgi:hypothetical protein